MHVIPLFPVSGFLAKNTNKLIYSPRSIHSCFNTFLLAFGTAELILVVKFGFSVGIGFSAVSHMIFYVVTLISGIALRILATEWPKVIKIWCKMESTFLRHPYQPPKRNLTVVLSSISIFMFVFMLSK